MNDPLLGYRVTGVDLSPDAHRLAVARDAILCAATNLESPHPQQIGGEAVARLRAAADLLTKLDAEGGTYLNEIGANARGEMLTEARAVLLENALRRIATDLPDYLTDLRDVARRALGEVR